MTESFRIGIAGLGTVGTEVCRILEQERDRIAERAGRRLEVVSVCARSRDKDRGIDLSDKTWVDDPVQLAKTHDLHVFVELMGGEDGPAQDAVAAALGAGRSVVTANKALLAAHGLTLGRLAEDKDAQLNFEAAVAGGIPIVKVLREALAGNQVERVYGILNGTSNYILTEMAETGRNFADVLAEAQSLGYAEADPSFDIGGQDAAHKLAILSSLAFGLHATIDDFNVFGIEKITSEDISAATELGYKIRLLAVAHKVGDELDMRVEPVLVEAGAQIAQVSGVTNAVAVDAAPLGRLVLEGPGAGGGATASAVISDLIDIARGARYLPFGCPTATLKPAPVLPLGRQKSEYYLRFMVEDVPGVLAAITEAFASYNISLETIIQRGTRKGGILPIVVVTHECEESGMNQVLKSLASVKGLLEKPHILRIEYL